MPAFLFVPVKSLYYQGPVGVVVVALALAGVPWTKWARFMVPLQLLFLAAGFASLAVAVAIGWGPF